MNSERGSILPLGIGLITLTLTLVLLFIELTGIQIRTVTIKQATDVLALEVSGQLHSDGIPPVVGLDYRPVVRSQLADVSGLLSLQPTVVEVMSKDGLTIEATICESWRSITGLSFGQFGSVCASSKARVLT